MLGEGGDGIVEPQIAADLQLGEPRPQPIPLGAEPLLELGAPLADLRPADDLPVSAADGIRRRHDRQNLQAAPEGLSRLRGL